MAPAAPCKPDSCLPLAGTEEPLRIRVNFLRPLEKAANVSTPDSHGLRIFGPAVHSEERQGARDVELLQPRHRQAPSCAVGYRS
jgi:hypothetical protein